jgi:PPOX class probable F420-dependent enzyme
MSAKHNATFTQVDAASPQHHEASPQHHEASPQHHEAASQHDEASSQHHDASPQSHDASSQHLEAPTQHHEAPTQRYEASPQSHEAPTQHYEASSQPNESALRHGACAAAQRASAARQDAGPASMNPAAASALAAFVDQKTVVLTTYRRDGTPVNTPINIAVDGDHAYIRSFEKAWKVRRMRNNPSVAIAPSTTLGRVTGSSVLARARRLDERESKLAARALARKHPLLQGVLVPLAHRLFRFKTGRTVHFEVTPVQDAARATTTV